MGILLGPGSGCQSAAAVRKAADRRAAPAFTLKDAMGRTVNLSDYKGQVVLLNFWATDCGPCKIEIPWFIGFERTFKSEGFAVLGVALDEEGWEVVKPYMEKSGINYRMAMGDETTAQKYGGIDSIPSTFVLDREGRIAATHVGLVSKSVYEQDIAALLGATR